MSDIGGMGMSWLGEMEVVEAVRSYLETKGFKINRVVKNTTERGADIVATSPSENVIIKIEARGQTSSDQGSKRLGGSSIRIKKRTTWAELWSSASAILTRALVRGALPEDDYNKRLVDGIKKSLGTLGLLVFFVSKNSGVSVIGDLPL